MSTIKSSDEHLTLNADGSSKDIKLQSNASEKVIVKSSGNVGIGITSPLDILHLNDPDDDCVINLDTAQANKNSIVKFSDPDAQGRGFIQYNHTTDSLRTVVAGTERTRIHSDGVLSVPAGVALGVAASSNASSNTLDDYEEGSWTPAFTGSSGSAGSVAHSVQEGYYTKIGRLVTCQFNLTLTNRGSWSGEARLTGLPFDPADTFPAAGSVSLDNVNVPNDASGHDVYVNPGATYFRFYYTQDFASRTFVQVNQVTDSADFNGTISYIV